MDSADSIPPEIDPVAAQRWAARPAADAAWLHEEVALRMQDRLQWIKKAPTAWAHWEPLQGGLQAHRKIASRYKDADAFMVFAGVDSAKLAIKSIAKPWWNLARWMGPSVVCGMPPDASVQLLWANMLLHTSADPLQLIKRWHRALAVDGFLMFSCLGPDTAKELRSLYAHMGWPPPSHPLTDMHDWGDMLVQAGFAEPIMDMERIVLQFPTPERALHELRGLGRNLHRDRFYGTRTKAWLAQLKGEMAQKMQGSGGEAGISLTFEVIYGHAFKPPPKIKMSAQSAVSMQDMRAMLAANRPP